MLKSSDEMRGRTNDFYFETKQDRPPCDKVTQRWVRELFGTGTGLPAAKARSIRRDNMRRHAKWMARNDPV